MRKVEVELVAVWRCPDCGVSQRVKPRELTADEAEDTVRLIEGLEEWQEVDPSRAEGWVAIPELIVCSKCGSEFEIEDDEE